MLNHGTASMAIHMYTMLILYMRTFIDRIDINVMDIYFHLISSELWLSGYNGGLVIWRPCGVSGSNPTVDKIFL